MIATRATAVAIIFMLGVLVYPCNLAQAQPIKTPGDLLLWLHKRLYPSAHVPAPPPPVARPTKRKPIPTVRSKPAPEVTPVPAAQPKPKKPAKVAKPKVKKPQPTRVKTKQPTQSISAADCKRLRDAVATYGNATVYFNARMHGYTPAEIAWAKRYCGVR